MFWEFKLPSARRGRTTEVAGDGGGILQKQITLMTCNCGASQVIRLDYALINSMSDPLQQASKDHIIIPLLI